LKRVLIVKRDLLWLSLDVRHLERVLVSKNDLKWLTVAVCSVKQPLFVVNTFWELKMHGRAQKRVVGLESG
jgi:hypothetical protein